MKQFQEFSLKSISIPKQLYKVCTNKKNFDETLNYLLKKNNTYNLKKLNKIKKNYFNLYKNKNLINFEKIL